MSQVITWTVTLLWTLWVPRMFGPEGMGLIALALSASNILVVIAGLGTRTVLVKAIAADMSQAPKLIGGALILRAGAAVPCLVLTALYVHFGRLDPSLATVLYIGAGIAIASLFQEPLIAAFQGIERMEYLAYSEVLVKGGVGLAGILIALAGAAAVGQVWLNLVLVTLALLASAYWIRPFFRIDFRPGWAFLSRLFRQSLTYWAFALFLTVYLWIDALMLAVLAPKAVLGWYGVSTRLMSTMMFLPLIVSTVWLPRLSASYTAGDDELKQAARVPLETVLVLGLPMSFGAALVATPLIGSLFGPSFSPAVPVFAILAISSLPTFVNILVNQVLVASDKQVVWTKVMLAAALLNPALNLVLIPYFQSRMLNGAIGTAVSLLVTEVLMVILGIIVIRRFLDRATLHRLVRACLATLGMAAVVSAASRSGLLMQIVLGFTSFAALGVALRVANAKELRDARSAVTEIILRLRGRLPASPRGQL
jgi:O-antigen/teichoic acid export membrane protein